MPEATTTTVQVEIRNVYGEDKVYPRDFAAGRFAAIAGTKTLTRTTLLNIAALGFEIQVLDRYGNVSRTFRAGQIPELPPTVAA